MDKELEYRRSTGGFTGRFEAHEYDIDALPNHVEPVDYIFTDPPYGGHIAYIDLSTLWNTWNGRSPGAQKRHQELIVGGELGLSDDACVSRLHDSVGTCLRLLKPGRWLSVVFQHWSTAYFDAILTGAADGGGDLRAAISQVGDPVWSMHKKKGKQSVLDLVPGRCDGCAPQKVDPALIARVRPTIVGCFWPVFFFADHRSSAW